MASAMSLRRDAGELEVELEAGDAVVGAAEFEVHVAVVIFAAEDVGEEEVALEVVRPRRTR